MCERGGSKSALGSVSPVLAELFRPPPHRGPLIAAGAVVLATGLALGELRIDVDQLAAPFHLLALGVAAVSMLALGLQAPNEGGRPPAYQSVLLVTGLLLLYPALLRLADVLGAELGNGYPAGELTWVSIVAGAVALYAGLRRRSAICLLIAAIAGAVALLNGWQWIFENDTFTASRWLLLACSVALALAPPAAGRLAARARAARRRRRDCDPGDRPPGDRQLLPAVVEPVRLPDGPDPAGVLGVRAAGRGLRRDRLWRA